MFPLFFSFYVNKEWMVGLFKVGENISILAELKNINNFLDDLSDSSCVKL